METNNVNQLKINLWRLILAIIIVNALGYYLRYSGLNTYIIILGFRFHISFVLPIIIVYNSNFLPYIKKSFLKPEWEKAFFPVLLIFLPIILTAGGLYFFQKIDLGDPEYFYEFGISSIADYPIYLIWNFPQMILIFIFLVSVSFSVKFRFIVVASLIFCLFIFELVPINKAIIQYPEIGILLICSLVYSIMINYFRNIYWFGISLFTLFWIAILAFGTSSKTIINLLFASRYNEWEGFLDVIKQYTPYTIPVYFGIALIVSLIFYLSSFRKI
jgi:hypothetical protein